MFMLEDQVNPQQEAMADLVDQVVGDQELIIKLQLEEQHLNLVNLVYQDHVVLETQVVEIQGQQHQILLIRNQVVVVELVVQELMVLFHQVRQELVVMVKQVI